MNNWSGIGRLTKDIELKYMQGSGKAIAKFTVAINREYKNASGGYDADFINCLAFDKRAELIAKYFKKGSQIALKGRIQTGSYDAQDGTKRYTTEILVEGITFVGGNNDSNNTNGMTYAGTQQNNTPVNDNSMGFMDDMVPVDDGDMPF